MGGPARTITLRVHGTVAVAPLAEPLVIAMGARAGVDVIAIGADIGHTPASARTDYQALLRPLFMPSFLVDDFLAENEFFGAEAVMLSSASSKTAFGLAHLLHTRDNGIKVIGLTSAGNTSFVKSLGCYDEVVSYDRVTTLPAPTMATRSGFFLKLNGNS